MGIRLLPLIVVVALLMLGLKMFDMFGQGTELSNLLLVAETRAKEEPAKEEKPEDKKEEDKKEDKKEEKTEAKPEGGSHNKPKEKSPEAPAEEAKDLKQEQPQYSPKELELLQNLTKRREELDARERDIAVQGAVLKAAAAKMEERVAELKKLEAEATDILKQYQEKEDKKIKSLVRIYENMKPKDAARIFEKMEMPVLLEVVSHMKEAKAAPILAKMDPKNAKEVTTELAGRRRLPDPDNSYKN